MIEFTTAEGRSLTVTANHPVLTPQGFVAAQTLREGDELLCYRDEPGVAPLGQRAERDEDKAQPTAEQIFGALAHASGVELASYRPDDFHGEAARFDGEIQVVGSYRVLTLDVQAVSAKQFGKLVLEATNSSAIEASELLTSAHRTATAADASPRGAALPLDGGSIASAPLEQLSSAPASHWDGELAQSLVDDLTANAKLASELLDRGAGKVSIDKVVGVRQFDFSGHVYDLATRQGWLVAGGIMASNCRCRVTSIREARAKEMGIRSGAEIRGLPDDGFTPNALVSSSLADLLSP
jgi:hypothetical protein